MASNTSKGNKRARTSNVVENSDVDKLLKKQEEALFSQTIEQEKDIDKIDFEKIEQLIANQLAGLKESKTNSEDCEDQSNIPNSSKTDVVFLNESSPFAWQWTFNDRTVR